MADVELVERLLVRGCLRLRVDDDEHDLEGMWEHGQSPGVLVDDGLGGVSVREEHVSRASEKLFVALRAIQVLDQSDADQAAVVLGVLDVVQESLEHGACLEVHRPLAGVADPIEVGDCGAALHDVALVGLQAAERHVLVPGDSGLDILHFGQQLVGRVVHVVGVGLHHDTCLGGLVGRCVERVVRRPLEPRVGAPVFDARVLGARLEVLVLDEALAARVPVPREVLTVGAVGAETTPAPLGRADDGELDVVLPVPEGLGLVHPRPDHLDVLQLEAVPGAAVEAHVAWEGSREEIKTHCESENTTCKLRTCFRCLILSALNRFYYSTLPQGAYSSYSSRFSNSHARQRCDESYIESTRRDAVANQ